jgi:hypothetical protein
MPKASEQGRDFLRLSDHSSRNGVDVRVPVVQLGEQLVDN